MTRKPFFLLCLLILLAVDRSDAQAVVFQDAAGNRLNTWTARSSSGVNLMGTWTATPDEASGTVTGTWTLINAQGNTVTGGLWSASKSPDGWVGAWRAVIDGRGEEHSGTWSAGVGLKRNAGFSDLFGKALQSVVVGNWRYGGHSGSWSIQAFK